MSDTILRFGLEVFLRYKICVVSQQKYTGNRVKLNFYTKKVKGILYLSKSLNQLKLSTSVVTKKTFSSLNNKFPFLSSIFKEIVSSFRNDTTNECSITFIPYSYTQSLLFCHDSSPDNQQRCNLDSTTGRDLQIQLFPFIVTLETNSFFYFVHELLINFIRNLLVSKTKHLNIL